MKKLHLGCGKNIKDGFINIDQFVKAPGVENIDVLNMPFPDDSIDEILSEHMIEHLPFESEEPFWRELFRVLKPGGRARIEAPDLEWLCAQFLKAKDEFTEFYKVGAVDHYFGHGRSIEHRWGMITTHIFGNQNGDGQFHYNGYTKGKFFGIQKILGFRSCAVQIVLSKGAQSLVADLVK